MAGVILKNLVKRFGKTQVLHSIDLEITDGELMLYRSPTLTKNIFKLPFFVINFFIAVRRAKKIIRENSVAAVVGMGGYVSAPALFAGVRLKVPVFLCEQNTVPGKVTKLFEKYAERIYITFNATREYLKSKVSDNLLLFSIKIYKYSGFIFNKNSIEKKGEGFWTIVTLKVVLILEIIL